jgi:hypothetical protein
MTSTKRIPRKRQSLRKGPVCSICKHEHRVLIESTRIAGASLDNISSKYNVSRDAVFRYMRAHVSEDLRAEYLSAVPLKELAEKAAAEGCSVLQYLSIVRSVLMNQLQLAASVSRGIFQRMIQRQKYFGGDAKGRIIFTIRCITESSGNEGALIGPVVSAVSSCLTPELTNRGLKVIEAFDKISLLSILETMRGLDVFSKYWLSHYFSIAIRNKLFNILGPAVLPAKPAKVKARPKSPKRRQPTRMAA